MPGSNAPAAKTLLTFTPCSIDPGSGRSTPDDGNAYSVMINPAELTEQLGIGYQKEVTPGHTGTPMKFVSMKPSTVSFSLVLDGTGVVPPPTQKARGLSVRDHLKALREGVYKLDSETHQPNHVRLVWGSYIFYGRLTSLSTQYTLFSPNGEPLRARVSLSFVEFKTKSGESRENDMHSPDLSHSVEVVEGDTLPLLCRRIYGDERYYMAVARFNDLDDFRRLRPGTRLHFPPLS